MEEFEEWLDEGYERSIRVAYLILGNQADAEDAVQDAFLRAWRFRDSLSDAANVQSWLYRVVVNSCNSHLRRDIPRRRRRVDDDELDDVASKRDAEARVDDAGDVMAALDDLPEHLRVVVVLRYYAGLSESEIAAAIRRKPGTVKSRLFDARQRLATHPALQPLTADARDSYEVNQ